MRLKKRTFLVPLLIVASWLLIFFGTSFFINKGYLDKLFTNIEKSPIDKNINQGKKPESEMSLEKSKAGAINEVIESMSKKFVTNCFARDEYNINALLSKDTAYIKSPDGSSFIRYTGSPQHVEGYMHTDKRLEEFRQSWCYIEGDTALAGVEIVLEGNRAPVIWYLYFKKENDQWKIFMLENE